MTEIWLATGNPKKAVELRRILPEAYEVHSLGELGAASRLEIVEDAPDFLGNARKKSTQTAAFLSAELSPDKASSILVLADDSGLSVDALGGEPGVHSARYAGEGASDEDRCQLLLERLAEVPEEQRTARFVCALSLRAMDGPELFFHEASCEGMILRGPRGKAGFGYDPVFLPEDAPEGREGASFAELTPTEKDGRSHRGKALRALVDFLARESGGESAHRKQNP